MSLLNRHQIFIDNQCYASLKGVEGVLVKIYKKRKVFSEALAMAFPTAILQMDYAAVHIALLTNLLVGCLAYRFINENVSKRLYCYIPQEGS